MANGTKPKRELQKLGKSVVRCNKILWDLSKAVVRVENLVDTLAKEDMRKIGTEGFSLTQYYYLREMVETIMIRKERQRLSQVFDRFYSVFPETKGEKPNG